MTKIEAEKVIKVLLEADNGCSYCSAKLVKKFIDDFTEYEELARRLFKEKYDEEIEAIIEEEEELLKEEEKKLGITEEKNDK